MIRIHVGKIKARIEQLRDLNILPVEFQRTTPECAMY